MANILKSTYNATNQDLKNYFNVKKTNKNTRWSGYGNYSTLTPMEKENLRQNLLNDLSKRVSRNNSAMGNPKINGPSAPPLPKATVVNTKNGNLTKVPVYNVTRNEFETLKGNVNKLKSRTGFGGAGLATLETGANVARRGAAFAGKKALNAAAYAKIQTNAAKARAGQIGTYLGEQGSAYKAAVGQMARNTRNAARETAAAAAQKARNARNATRKAGHTAIIGSRASRSNQYVANKYNAVARGTFMKPLSKLTEQELIQLVNSNITNNVISSLEPANRMREIKKALAANKTKFFFRRRY